MPEETTERSAVDIQDVDLSFDKTKVVERPFAAEIRVDMKEAGNYGPQYHLGVHPLHKADPEIVWHSWSAIPIRDGAPSPTGQFGEIYDALRKVFGQEVPAPGVGGLLGKIGMFAFRPYEYYDKRAKTRKRSQRDSLIALRHATAADVEAAVNRQVLDVAGTGNTPVQTTGALDNDQLQRAVAIMAGKSAKEYTKGLMKDESVPQAVRDAIFAGTAVEQATSAGLITVTTDGVVTVQEG